jgi:hypothetical protein
MAIRETARRTPLTLAWLSALVVTAAGSFATYTTCPGCIDRTRINGECEWARETSFRFDSRNEAHRTHLVADAHLAEELAIRYADREHGRRFGIEHHGGLLDDGRVRSECLSRLFQAIERHHRVTSALVATARAGRNPTFDVTVGLLFLPLYAVATIIVSRGVARRFPPDERPARWVAMGLASLAVSLLGLQAFRLWGAVWEVIRVGNGHMTSVRAASRSAWVHHVDGPVLWGMALFLVIAVCWLRVDARAPEPPASAPRGLLV